MLSIFALASVLACMNTPITITATPLLPVGKARFNKAFISLYDASLCANSTPFYFEDNKSKTFALSLEYRRGFTSEQLVKATIIEMARLSNRKKSEFETLKTPLAECFPTVKKGDNITGVSIDANSAKFYLNANLSCEIEWENFQNDFFGIWLSNDTRSPKKSRRLRGL
ncbi:MAG: chalcone isomerase family protein [Robiginitomaculum sp.]|nr:chalcone isomerase family protein [Robiginitomaculum sp.]